MGCLGQCGYVTPVYYSVESNLRQLATVMVAQIIDDQPQNGVLV